MSKDNKIINSLCYIAPLFLIGLFVRPGSSTTRFHVNQGLVLFLFELAGSLVLYLLGLLLGLIPVVGVIIMSILGVIFTLISILFTVFGIRNCIVGETRELPYIGHFQYIR